MSLGLGREIGMSGWWRRGGGKDSEKCNQSCEQFPGQMIFLQPSACWKLFGRLPISQSWQMQTSLIENLGNQRRWITLECRRLDEEAGLTQKDRHTSFYCASLYCISQILHFLQIQGLWQPSMEQVYQHPFSTAFPHFMSLHHILVIPTVFQTFSLSLYLLWWSVIFDIIIGDGGREINHTHIRLNYIRPI